MTKSEILASDLPAVEKIWQIASQRSDIGKGHYGVVAAPSLDGAHIYERLGECCCPIGALLIGEEREQNSTYTAAGLLGVSEKWVDSFIDGFDETGPVAPVDADGWVAGQEIRRRFIERGVELG